MRSLRNAMIFLAAMLFTIAATAAFAGDTIFACPAGNGTVMYTNKDVKGCKVVVGPELSVVPSYDKHQHTNRTLEHNGVEAITPVPVTKSSRLLMPEVTTESEVVTKTCALYKDWILINERTKGGFENNDVDDTKKRLFLTKIFGSGFSPSMCKEQ